MWSSCLKKGSLLLQINDCALAQRRLNKLNRFEGRNLPKFGANKKQVVSSPEVLTYSITGIVLGEFCLDEVSAWFFPKAVSLFKHAAFLWYRLLCGLSSFPCRTHLFPRWWNESQKGSGSQLGCLRRETWVFETLSSMWPWLAWIWLCRSSLLLEMI